MASLFTGLWRAFEFNRTANALHRLTDHQLSDIGLRRDEIGKHVSSLFSDPSSR